MRREQVAAGFYFGHWEAESLMFGETGQALGAHLSAAATLTLALPKTGLGVAAVGELQLADIGIPAEVYRRIGVDVPPALFGARYRVALEPA